MPDCTNIIVEPVFAAEDGLTLSILLYLDEGKDFRERYKLELLQCVLTRSGARVDVVDRSRAIDDTLLRDYHEVWFFLTSRNADERLTDAECFALRDWMDHGGGVLITGDHADVNADRKFVGLGRPIGARIPRARHMREWDAAPGVRRGLGSINTTEISAGRDIAPQLLEQDATPQRLLLPTEVDGEPHAIFLDAQGRLLDRLPDHRHEGKVLDTVKKPVGEPEIPAHIDEWQGSELKVKIVARGIDWLRGDCSNLMAVWDGHQVRSRKGDGRRVAASAGASSRTRRGTTTPIPTSWGSPRPRARRPTGSRSRPCSSTLPPGSRPRRSAARSASGPASGRAPSPTTWSAASTARSAATRCPCSPGGCPARGFMI
jgi:hypothetical protein